MWKKFEINNIDHWSTLAVVHKSWMLTNNTKTITSSRFVFDFPVGNEGNEENSNMDGIEHSSLVGYWSYEMGNFSQANQNERRN